MFGWAKNRDQNGKHHYGRKIMFVFFVLISLIAGLTTGLLAFMVLLLVWGFFYFILLKKHFSLVTYVFLLGLFLLLTVLVLDFLG